MSLEEDIDDWVSSIINEPCYHKRPKKIREAIPDTYCLTIHLNMLSFAFKTIEMWYD